MPHNSSPTRPGRNPKRLTLTLLLASLVLALSASTALAATISCVPGQTCYGTSFDDTITGTSAHDTILAQRGDDKIFAQDGVSDLVNCGDGDRDIVYADAIDARVDCETVRLPPPPPPPSSPGVTLGVFPGNTSGNPAWDANMTGLKEFESLTAKKTSYVEFFHQLRDDSSGSCLTTPTTVKSSYMASGYTPVIRLETGSVWTPDAIIAGQADACLNSEANVLKGFGGTVLISPFHEMNGNWMPWSVGQGTTTEADHINAWRHMHDVFVAAGATNVKWVWNPNVKCPTYCETRPYANYYPGDAYVDYLALDGYNWAGVHGDSWRSFDSIYEQSYNEITALSASKPLMVAEYASTEQFGFSKGQWISDARSVVKSGKYPRIKAMLWFHSNQEGALWRVDTSADSLNAYKAFVADPYYQGT